MKALLNVHDLMDKQIQSYALGFIVGPCINASGRLESAEKALNLFLEEDEEKAKQMVEFFRQDIEQSRLLTKNKYQSRGLFIRFKEQVSRLLSPLL